MCQKCNEALLAAAQAASMLARAAKDLYSINQQAEATTLAKAAAELFELVEDEVKPGDTGTASAVSPNEAKDAKGSPEAVAPDDVKLPQGFRINDEGIVYIGGVPIGRMVVLGKPTRH